MILVKSTNAIARWLIAAIAAAMLAAACSSSDDSSSDSGSGDSDAPSATAAASDDGSMGDSSDDSAMDDSSDDAMAADGAMDDRSSDDSTMDDSGDGAADDDAMDEPEAEPAYVPSVVATTGIWADVVSSVGCNGSVTVTTIIPLGGDPHTFEPSLRDRETMDKADIVVSNGLGLEESIHDTLEAVAEDGTPVFEMGDHVETIEFDIAAAHGHGHGDEEEEEEEGEDDHGEGGADPHIWFDLQKVANALPDLADALIAAGADAEVVQGCVESYQQAMVQADSDILDIVATIEPERRILITNHDSMGYFADRYGFEVVGTVIPANTTAAEANPHDLEELAHIIEDEGVPAVFSEGTTADDDAQALASEAGNIAVVPLLTGSLAPAGELGDTLIGLLLHNAQTIADALNAGS